MLYAEALCRKMAADVFVIRRYAMMLRDTRARLMPLIISPRV